MFVLHMDVDAFFVQAEQLKHPSIQGKAVAVQQHQDIIAANHAAKCAGVTKHMAPAEARRLLKAVGGTVVHVHLAPGGRVSYQPYRELSARMMRLLRALPWAAVVEKASIDEAYLLLQPGPGAAADADEEEESVSPQAALQRAHEAKAAVQQQLGMCVSVGVAPSRLLAKLASAAAKPDGVRLVADQQAALHLLSQTPAHKLPGYGGKAAEAFERHGIAAATDLQRYSQHQLEQLLGLKPAAAAQLAQWCRGVDTTPERGPPKTLSVQMSLTPQLLPMHPSQGRTVSASGGPPGVLEPLVVGKPGFRRRVRQLMEAMGLDLVQRVLEDSAEEGGRWPRTLTASLRAFGAGRDHTFTSRSAAFPANSLAQQHARQRVQQAQQAQQVQQQQQQQPGQEATQQLGLLEEAVVCGLEALIHQAASACPATATVVELRLTATSFQAAAAATAAAPITRFFAAAQPAHQEQQQQQESQQQQQESEQEQQEENEGQPAGQPGHAEASSQQAPGNL
ncbi:hypothetical protein CHLNCDRAFT_140768 [Chlorella variabilis]|uniref:UmuC domain-containing protein n=1 Tax=Chlorella variabilis TaxID=554065 RepID=E1Z660_CHLVA|nr:hypothetical protein CHLNCDRAFT_140768 [Chlorella variabilis]EFN58875.1 hypothetical protein CHLNCDRAFT_140768 [Chlorella variabilis]|eukprot:XP_005850977.1 hypothetical protein CHLNCDRAFT_140768 [Chlorella variabilis]